MWEIIPCSNRLEHRDKNGKTSLAPPTNWKNELEKLFCLKSPRTSRNSLTVEVASGIQSWAYHNQLFDRNQKLKRAQATLRRA